MYQSLTLSSLTLVWRRWRRRVWRRWTRRRRSSWGGVEITAVQSMSSRLGVGVLLHLVEHAHGRGDDAGDVIRSIGNDHQVALLGHLGQLRDVLVGESLDHRVLAALLAHGLGDRPQAVGRRFRRHPRRGGLGLGDGLDLVRFGRCLQAHALGLPLGGVDGALALAFGLVDQFLAVPFGLEYLGAAQSFRIRLLLHGLARAPIHMYIGDLVAEDA